MIVQQVVSPLIRSVVIEASFPSSPSCASMAKQKMVIVLEGMDVRSSLYTLKISMNNCIKCKGKSKKSVPAPRGRNKHFACKKKNKRDSLYSNSFH